MHVRIIEPHTDKLSTEVHFFRIVIHKSLQILPISHSEKTVPFHNKGRCQRKPSCINLSMVIKCFHLCHAPYLRIFFQTHSATFPENAERCRYKKPGRPVHRAPRFLLFFSYPATVSPAELLPYLVRFCTNSFSTSAWYSPAKVPSRNLSSAWVRNSSQDSFSFHTMIG